MLTEEYIKTEQKRVLQTFNVNILNDLVDKIIEEEPEFCNWIMSMDGRLPTHIDSKKINDNHLTMVSQFITYARAWVACREALDI